MAAKSQDKIVFGAALVVLLASAGWMAMQGSKLSSLHTAGPSGAGGEAYKPAGIDAPEVPTKTWPLAPAQTSGQEWVYDVFTPPEIYYNDVTKKFSVTPPKKNFEEPKFEIPFGVTLVKVRQDSFRLQLVGYIGGEGDYRGNFENALTGETIIARSGKELTELGLKIKSFEVKRNKIITEDSMPVYETEATAVVVDLKTGEEVSLTNKRRYISGKPIASIKADGSDKPADYRAGDMFTAGDASYKVVAITYEPASVVIEKSAANLPAPLTKTLTPAPTADAVPAPAADPGQTPAPSATAAPFPFGG